MIWWILCRLSGLSSSTRSPRLQCISDWKCFWFSAATASGSVCTGHVVELIVLDAVPAFEAVIPVQLIVHAPRTLREMFAVRIRIAAHPKEWQLCHRKRHGFVEIHVLHKAFGIEEVIALPMRWQRRQRASLNSASISSPLPKITYSSSCWVRSGVTVAIARVAPLRPLEWPGLADLLDSRTSGRPASCPRSASDSRGTQAWPMQAAAPSRASSLARLAPLSTRTWSQ